MKLLIETNRSTYGFFKPGESVERALLGEDPDSPGSGQTLPVHQVDLVAGDGLKINDLVGLVIIIYLINLFCSSVSSSK